MFLDETFSMGLRIRFFGLVSETDGDLSRLLCVGFSIQIIFEDEWEVDFLELGGWESFSTGLGIRFFELVSVVDGFLSGLLCFGFSIRLEFEDEREEGFSELGGWESNLSFELEIRF